jgi:hypothetical protein
MLRADDAQRRFEGNSRACKGIAFVWDLGGTIAEVAHM